MRAVHTASPGRAGVTRSSATASAPGPGEITVVCASSRAPSLSVTGIATPRGSPLVTRIAHRRGLADAGAGRGFHLAHRAVDAPALPASTVCTGTPERARRPTGSAPALTTPSLTTTTAVQLLPLRGEQEPRERIAERGRAARAAGGRKSTPSVARERHHLDAARDRARRCVIASTARLRLAGARPARPVAKVHAARAVEQHHQRRPSARRAPARAPAGRAATRAPAAPRRAATAARVWPRASAAAAPRTRSSTG